MNSLLRSPLLKRLWKPLFWFVFILANLNPVKAQERPPRPIIVTVDVARQLQFGSFIQTGSDGTVTVDYNGTRTASGSVILPHISSSAFPTSALFIVDAEPGTLITIVNGSNAILSNGGFNMELQIGEASTGSPFITKNKETYVYIGGTLLVKSLAANPAGSYSGFFNVTFIQQ